MSFSHEGALTRKSRIELALKREFAPLHLEVVNESHMHSVPPGSETHFRVIVVSDRFDGLRMVQRQRWIYQLLQAELESGLHALAQQSYTQYEWTKRGAAGFASPECASKGSGTG